MPRQPSPPRTKRSCASSALPDGSVAEAAASSPGTPSDSEHPERLQHNQEWGPMPDLIYAEPLDEAERFNRGDMLLRSVVGGVVVAGAIVIGGRPGLSLARPSFSQRGRV